VDVRVPHTLKKFRRCHIPCPPQISRHWCAHTSSEACSLLCLGLCQSYHERTCPAVGWRRWHSTLSVQPTASPRDDLDQLIWVGLCCACSSICHPWETSLSQGPVSGPTGALSSLSGGLCESKLKHRRAFGSWIYSWLAITSASFC
jgi:hypothetical protein